MGGSGSSKSNEPMGDCLSRRIAAEVQGSLDEYMVNNPDFPVSCRKCAGWMIGLMNRLLLLDQKQ